MLIHSSRKVVDDNLSLKIDDKTVERVRSFKFLGVVVNDTLTWVDHIDMYVKRSLVVWTCFVGSLGFCLNLFCFFISSHTFFPTLTTVMLFGSDVLKLSPFALNPCWTLLVGLFFIDVNSLLLLLLVVNLAYPLCLQEENSILRKLSSSASIPLAQRIFPSSSPPPAPPTTPDLLPLLNWTFLQSDHLMVKGHSALLVPLCGDHSQPLPDN